MARLSQNRTGGPRRTTVARTPYWVPEQSGWTFVPTGPTHKAKVEILDEFNPDAGAREADQYEEKGWTPLYRVPDGDPRRDLLPRNHQDLMRDHKAIPVMPDAKVVKAAYEKLGAVAPVADEAEPEKADA